MEFLFHSVFNEGDHAKYFNIYKLENDRFLAECHHFNRERFCDGDFEVLKEEDGWKASNPHFLPEAKHIGGEIERMEASPQATR